VVEKVVRRLLRFAQVGVVLVVPQAVLGVVGRQPLAHRVELVTERQHNPNFRSAEERTIAQSAVNWMELALRWLVQMDSVDGRVLTIEIRVAE